MAKITPETAILNALRSQSLSYKQILGELIDNAFDAGANRIRIEVAGKDLIVEDDGNGCADLASMVTLGKHIKQSGTKLGRYGVGLKDAALWLGGPTRIRSVHGGSLRTVYIDWDHLVDWEIQDPAVLDAEPGERGTRLTFHNICHRFPDGQKFTELVSDLSYTFTPALKRGKQIVFRGKNKQTVTATRFELPRLENVVDKDIVVDGKQAHVYVGVVPEGVPNPRPGIAYTHGFRVIVGETALGCGGRSPARISGWVSLDGGWRLNKNKDGVNVDSEALGDAVYAVIKDIVDVAAKQAFSMHSSALARRVTSMLRGMDPSTIDQTRDQTKEKPGSVQPRNSGRIHRNATKGKPGPSRRTTSLGSMNIEFGDCPQPSTGRVDFPGKTIWLAENNSWVAHLIKSDNADALVTVAGNLFAGEDPSDQPALPAKWAKQTNSMTFAQRAGLVLQDQNKSALKVVA